MSFVNVNKSRQRRKDKEKNAECYNCGRRGHYARNCTHDPDDEEKVSATTLDCSLSTVRDSLIFDSASHFSIVNREYLSGIMPEKHTFLTSSGGTYHTNEVGYLPGIGKCIAGNGKVNIISQSKLEEDGFKVTYDCKGYRCVKGDTELRFVKKNGLYVGDLTDILHINAPTISPTKLRSINTAKEFVKNAGFVSEQEALGMASDGNIIGLPVTADDIKLAFRIYGPPPEFIKGRTVYRHTAMDLSTPADVQGKDQILLADVVHVMGKSFLLGLATSTVDPLDLLVVARIDDQKGSTLRGALEDQTELLRGRGFGITEIITDPQSSLVGIPGVNATGAGDHIPKLDTR